MLIALALRVKGIGATNLWLDEANSWYVAQLPWEALVANVRSSPLGPLYFMVLKLWMQLFGDSEAALRAPSLIASVLIIPITYAIGVRVFTRRAATLGAVLLALSPLQLYFAQEARMYMLLTLFAMLSFLAYLRWRHATSEPNHGGETVGFDQHGLVAGADAGKTSTALVWYVVAGTIMVYMNVISATFIVAMNLDALGLLSRRGWRERHETGRREPASRATIPGEQRGGSGRATIMWLAANAAIAIAFLFYLFTVRLSIASASQGWRGALGIAGALRALVEYPLVALHGVYYYAHDFSLAAAELQRSRSMPAFLHFAELLVVQPLTLIVLVLAIGAGLARMFTGPRRAVLLAVVVPLVIGSFVSVSRQLDLSRYFLFVSPLLFLLIGYGLTKMTQTAGTVSGAMSLAILVLTTAFGISSYRDVQARDSDYRPVASTLESEHSAASVVLVKPLQSAMPLLYYVRNAHTAPVRGLPRIIPIAWALPSAPRTRVWLILDYRSQLYDDSPDALRNEVGAKVLSDRYVAGASGGVRVLHLETR